MVADFLLPLLFAGVLSAAPAARATHYQTLREDQDGRAVTLSAEWKNKPVVLIFCRGNR